MPKTGISGSHISCLPAGRCLKLQLASHLLSSFMAGRWEVPLTCCQSPGWDPRRRKPVFWHSSCRWGREQSTKLVRNKMEKAHCGQQNWYNKATVLLPTVENKLLAKWQGPYTVLRKWSPTTDEIEMPERTNPKQAFYINLLKEWKTPEIPPWQQMFFWTVEEEDVVVGEFAPTSHNSVSLHLSHLFLTQQQELQVTVPPDLFQERPGATNVVEHDIRLKDSTPSGRGCIISHRSWCHKRIMWNYPYTANVYHSCSWLVQNCCHHDKLC